MRARLEDGSIVELVKDCGCLHHEGPHWLHMNKVEEALNLADAGPDVIARSGRMAPLLAHHFAQLEVKRLEDLGARMRENGIIELMGEGE